MQYWVTKKIYNGIELEIWLIYNQLKYIVCIYQIQFARTHGEHSLFVYLFISQLKDKPVQKECHKPITLSPLHLCIVYKLVDRYISFNQYREFITYI